MDDLTTRKMTKEAADIFDAAQKPMTDLASLADLKAPTLDAAMAKLLNVEDIKDLDIGQGLHWAGYVIGSMCSKELSVEDCHRVLHAVATLRWSDAYDVCCDDDAGNQLDAIPAGCDVEHRYSADDVYRWGRFFRVATNEIAFGLENHFKDPEEYSTDDLIKLAVAAVDFMIDTFHPVYSRTLGS